MSVKGTIFLLEGGVKTPVMDVISSFFYRGRFDDFDATFMSEDDPEYKVPMNSTTDISVLKSEKWFDWKDENVKLAPGQKPDIPNFLFLPIQGERGLFFSNRGRLGLSHRNRFRPQ